MKNIILLLTVLTLAFSCQKEESEEFIDESVNTPTFNFMSGTYKYDIGLTLATTTKNTTIYYTVDGTEPTESSLIYTSPILIEDDETSMYIKAMSINDLGIKSDVTDSYYRINYTYDSKTFNSKLNLSDFQDNLKGKWIGSRSTPWTPQINIEVAFDDDGKYSSKSLTPDYNAFYYGTDDEVNSYNIFDVNSDGSAMGNIGRFNDSNTDEIKFIKFSEDLNVVSFEFWHNKEYGPLTYTLTRMD